MDDVPAAAGEPRPRRRGRVHPAWVAALVLVILVTASLLVGSQFPGLMLRLMPREDPARRYGVTRPLMASLSAKVAVGPSDDPSRHCSLTIGSGPGESGSFVTLGMPGAVHHLQDVTETTEDPQGHVVSFQGGLTREICRQAVLLAAREELGAWTRDAILGEGGPEARSGASLDLGGPLEVGVGVVLKLSRDAKPGSTPLLTRELVKLRPGTHDRIDLLGLVIGAEAASRDEIPKALRAAGLAGKKPTGSTEKVPGELPEGVERALRKMGFVDQFGAVRAVHEAIRVGGASEARLGALARGYAHLGLLTAHQWDAMHKAFHARSLLYAQRLVSSTGGSADALRHRSFALALAGLQKAAMADLAAAEALPGGSGEVSGWAKLVGPACRYDFASLGGANGPDSELAKLLAAVALEGASGSAALHDAALATVKANPECFRAIDLLCKAGGVSNLHRATVIGPRVLEEVVPLKLSALPQAPKGLTQQGLGSDLVTTLAEAGRLGSDRGEPSWQVASRFVRESRFMQTWRRLAFMRDAWSVPTGEYWEGVEGSLVDHPWRPFLLSFVVPANAPGSDFPAFAKGLNVVELDRGSAPLQQACLPVMNPEASFLMAALTYLHADGVAHDLTDAIRSRGEPVKSARRLLESCPNSPVAMGLLVEADWGFAQSRMADWEKVVGRHPDWLSGLIRHVERGGDKVELTKVLERYIACSPDQWAFQKLADSYRANGDPKRWRETLDRYLADVEDFGLGHAQVQVTIADDLMDRGEFDEARPYAESAAETAAAWAMDCLQRCAEGQQDWSTAETQARERAERYSNSSWTAWLSFCVQTGHGDLPGAIGWSRRFAELNGADWTGADLLPLGYLAWLEEDSPAAFATFQKATQTGAKDNLSELLLALTADACGESATRDAALDRARALEGPKTTVGPKLAGLFREALKAGPEGRVSLSAAEEVLKMASNKGRPNWAFVLARFLANRGRHEEAQPYWELVTRCSEANLWVRGLAIQALKEHPPAHPPEVPEPIHDAPKAAP